MSETVKRIRAEDSDLESLLSKKHYKIDYYQRDYSWGKDEVRELLNDLIVKFKESYKEGDKGADSAKYDQYFLGSVVINEKSDGLFIIDGQQRLTTLSLIFAAIYSISESNGEGIKDALDYVYSDNYGEPKFNILSDLRIPIMEYIVGKKDELSPEQKDSLLFKNYNYIIEYFKNNEILNSKDIIIFYYWLHKKVLMVKIETNSDKEAYTIFESMNDRGLPLTSLDMFKGYILSLAEDKRDKAIEIWDILQSKFDNQNELSRFLVELFRSKYAIDNPKDAYRANKKPYNDWDEIGKKYHKFIKEKRKDSNINIKNSGDVIRFLNELIYYAEYLKFLNDKKNNKQKGYESLYYLHQSKHTDLNILFYGLIEPYDSQKEVKTKIIAKFLDVRSGLLAWNMKDARKNQTNTEYFLAVMIKIRSQPERDSLFLLYTLHRELVRKRKMTNGWDKIRGESAPFLNSSQRVRNNTFYILSRVTTFVQNYSGQSDEFHIYYQDKYEIEHILAKDNSVNSGLFETQDELDFFRNKIGALGILDRKTNGSFQDDPYHSKSAKYPQHNRFLGILSKDMYSESGSFANHPGLNDMVKKYPQLKKMVKSYEVFDRKAISERNQLISEIANIIWNPDDMLVFADDEITTWEELAEYVYEKIDIEEIEDESITQYPFPIGKILCIRKGESCVEFTYDGLTKTTILKIINGKITDDTENNFSHTPLEKPFKEILKNLTKVKENSYNWEGSIENMPMKAPIYLLQGRVGRSNESIMNDYILKEE